MFGRIWDFIKRHRKKIVCSGVVVGGGYYLYRYARQKFLDFQEKEAAECLNHARHQHHFDSNQRTCNMTVLSMLPTLRETVIQMLKTDELTEQLKTSPPNKLQIWEDLKILSISRCVSIVYGCTLMCMFLRVQLNIIGGYMYIDNLSSKNGTITGCQLASADVQEKYLALIRQFFSKGFIDLVAEVKEAVTKETGSLSLKERLSIQNVEAILKHIRERVENGQENTLQEIPTLPLCRYMLDAKDCDQSEEESGLYPKLLKETLDVLESCDFHSVLKLCLDRGFAKLLDYIAEYYKQLQRADKTIPHFHEVAIPVAKLIPLINGLVHKLASDAPNPLVQELLLLDQTKLLAANIYEAFSQSDDSESADAQFAP